MKAVVLTGYGDVDKLDVREVADPVVGPGQIAVRVAGASINPVDMKIRRGDLEGRLRLELPSILGRDVAGEVIDVGPDVRDFALGDRVVGIVTHGYAELVVDDVDAWAKVPPELDLRVAAALPLVGLTGAQLIEEGVDPERGDTVLVTGALGSVGRSAVFAAKQRGAHVIAGVRAQQKDKAAELDVDAVVAIDDDDEIARLPPLNAIADTVGGETVEKLLAKVDPGGIVATVVGAPEGAEEREIDVHAILTHRDSKRLAELATSVSRGELVIPIETTMPLEEVRAAQTLAERHGVAKVVLVAA